VNASSTASFRGLARRPSDGRGSVQNRRPPLASVWAKPEFTAAISDPWRPAGVGPQALAEALPQATNALFKQVHQNGDGQISRQEWID
jgi:hypothetical protein